MRKIEKYELMYTNLTWIFILIGITHVILSDFIYQDDIKVVGLSLIYKFILLLTASIINAIKFSVIKKNKFLYNKLYYISRLLEPLIISLLISFLGFSHLAYVMYFFLVLVTCLSVGRKPALILIGYALAINLISQFAAFYFYRNDSFFQNKFVGDLLGTLFVFLILVLLALLSGSMYEDIVENDAKNKTLFNELENKYDQLAAAQEEIKVQNQRLKDTNLKIEDANNRLKDSLAELFTVQQVIQAISSVFHIKELLQRVNDIIIGVMGVSSSTIILYDEVKEKLKVHTTSITKKSDLITLNDNINCELLLEVIGSGEPILVNDIDENKHPFIQERDIGSLICAPLITKTKKFGLVLIEHKYSNAFNDNNLRLLNMIGQQVGIVMENAELYQKMHELATTDSLTGVYNRLYFQERLRDEFENAHKDKYDLSLAIFDIDYFKKFNDTYGHLFGDKVLKHIAELIKGSLRSGDIVARFGGEEFVILFPRTSIKEAYEKVEKLRETISRRFIRDELVTASVTVSFGLSSYPEFVDSEVELLKTADDALYKAKESGRNCVRVVSLNSAEQVKV